MNNRTLNCLGDMDINYGGELSINNASTPRMGSGKSIDVTDGFFTATGVDGANVTVTRYDTGYYAFNNYNYLIADYTIFEYMDANGIYYHNNAVDHELNNCTFRNGEAGGTLLKFEGYFWINVNNASFPTNAGSGAKNVTKTVIGGRIVFNNYTGAFGGPAFENDPDDQVYWPGTDVNARFINVTWSRPDSYLGASVTATVTVNNNGTQDIAEAVRIDLYVNYPFEPPAGTAGNYIESIQYLSAGTTKSFTFDLFSSDEPATWTSYFRLDTQNSIPETNETDNLWLPAITTDWYPLPEVINPHIYRLSPTSVRLEWGYPITVNRFNVYRGSEPYFTPAVENRIYQGTNDFLETPSDNEDQNFYIIKAERDMP